MMQNLNIGILNGGKSTRMGTPKSLLMLNGITFAEKIYNEAIKVTPSVFFVGNAPLSDDLKKRTIIDDEGKGPLNGIKRAFEYRRGDWVFLAIDIPLITADFINSIINNAGNKGYSIPFNRNEALYEPLCAFYNEAFLSDLFKQKEDGSLQKLFKKMSLQGDDLLFELGQKIINPCNSIEDYLKIKEITENK